MELSGRNYLVTAAHVIDELRNTDLFLGGSGELIPLDLDFICSIPQNGRREDDHYDFAWSVVSDEFFSSIGDAKSIKEADVSLNRVNTVGRVYAALGFPRSKNKKANPKTKALRPKFASYASTGKQMPDLYIEIGLSGNDHIAIEHKSQSLDRDGNKVNSYAPRGMSGGPLIDLGKMVSPSDLGRATPFSGKLAGVLIEKYEAREAILSVKIQHVIHSIQSHMK